MAVPIVGARTAYDVVRWGQLAELAVRGLHEIYEADSTGLPWTRRWDGRRAKCQGHSVRYALISLIGLARAPVTLGPQRRLAGRLWRRVAGASQKADLAVGDLGVGLWACSLAGWCVAEFAAERALRAYRDRPGGCNSIGLAWLLLGAEHAILVDQRRREAWDLADEAKAALLALYNPGTALFYRHARGGLLHGVSRRVACFANQIYPVMALAVHARRTGCRQAAVVAGAVADRLCQLQGRAGQWWWLYDVDRGDVVEGYPVFSVHQDGMAPMALLEAGRALGRCYAEHIE
ncbi:MAG: hypothetical protein ACE5K7_06430, partial [Phycisphaerae bacterium]